MLVSYLGSLIMRSWLKKCSPYKYSRLVSISTKVYRL